MFLGEVFQEVKFWRWLMDIRKLKVMVFRQITLFIIIEIVLPLTYVLYVLLAISSYLAPSRTPQIDHHTAFTMSKADLRKLNVIDLTLNTPALNQHIDRT
jgi:hypothetical protein